MANLFIIAAPSGCGKTSLVEALIKKQKTFVSLFLTLLAHQDQMKLMGLIITLSLLMNLKK